MTTALQRQLAEYDRALYLARETYRGMSSGERAVRAAAGKDLTEHAPSNRTEPACNECGGVPWPCDIVKGAIVYVDPRYN